MGEQTEDAIPQSHKINASIYPTDSRAPSFITASNSIHSFHSPVRTPSPCHMRFPYERHVPGFFSSHNIHPSLDSYDHKEKSSSQIFEDEFHSTLQRMESRSTWHSADESRRSSFCERRSNELRRSSCDSPTFHRRDKGKRKHSRVDSPDTSPSSALKNVNRQSIRETKGNNHGNFKPGPLRRPYTSPAGDLTFSPRYSVEQHFKPKDGMRATTWGLYKPTKTANSSTGKRSSSSGTLPNRSRSSSGRSHCSSIAPFSFNEILYPSRHRRIISETAAQKFDSFTAANPRSAIFAPRGSEPMNINSTVVPALSGERYHSYLSMERSESSNSSNASSTLYSLSPPPPIVLRRESTVSEDDTPQKEASQNIINVLHPTLSHGSTVMDFGRSNTLELEYAEIDRRRKSIWGWVKRNLLCGLMVDKQFYEEGINDNSSVRRYRLPIH